MTKFIDGYDTYQITDRGEVYSTPKDGKPYRFLKQEVVKKKHTNYRRVSLSKNGKAKRFQVHRLVAKAFVDNLLNKPCVNHLDNNGENNVVSNLVWATQSENILHAEKQGRMMHRIDATKASVPVSKAKTDSLVGNIYGGVELIKITRYGNSSSAKKRITRRGIFKCLECGEEYERGINSVVRSKPNGCRSCSQKERHRLQKFNK